jgi:hypothetical protein
MWNAYGNMHDVQVSIPVNHSEWLTEAWSTEARAPAFEHRGNHECVWDTSVAYDIVFPFANHSTRRSSTNAGNNYY